MVQGSQNIHLPNKIRCLCTSFLQFQTEERSNDANAYSEMLSLNKNQKGICSSQRKKCDSNRQAFTNFFLGQQRLLPKLQSLLLSGRIYHSISPSNRLSFLKYIATSTLSPLGSSTNTIIGKNRKSLIEVLVLGIVSFRSIFGTSTKNFPCAPAKRDYPPLRKTNSWISRVVAAYTAPKKLYRELSFKTAGSPSSTKQVINLSCCSFQVVSAVATATQKNTPNYNVTWCNNKFGVFMVGLNRTIDLLRSIVDKGFVPSNIAT
ncbi:hypothetical protein EYC80_010911 [Monilinia laxa]|uniref:Uncharacterized protein n=1 Tax=Monilinia laxa TaxID=61186 RepID=A0A5N6JPI9_MONLA|nr:hypothetical protein EYC80_010911 [Monilinia laxa]